MKRSTEMPARSEPSLGFCVLCLRDLLELPKEQRTEEHIVPKFLSGTGEMKILEGSCASCNAQANEQYEQTASKTVFLVPRLLLELKRRKRKTSSIALPLVAAGNHVIEGGDELFSEALANDAYPPLWTFPWFDPAGLLTGTEASIVGNLEKLRFATLHLGLPRSKTSNYTTREPSNYTAFALTIAKMAYCFAVAERGLHAIQADDLRALLRGERQDVFNFVGGPLEPERLTPRYLHAFYFRKRGEFVTVLVHLLASFGGPIFEVVIGKDIHMNAADKRVSLVLDEFTDEETARRRDAVEGEVMPLTL